MIRRILPAAALFALALAGMSNGAFAQTTAVTTLPPGGQTIGGPGLMVGAAFRTVWASNTALPICATVVGAAGNGATVTMTLNPSNTHQTFLATAQSMTVCGANETSVQLASNGGTIFWRVDRLN